MQEILMEIAKAIIWVSIGAVPTMVGLFIVVWSDVKSLKKSLNAAHAKIRELSGEECKSRNTPR